MGKRWFRFDNAKVGLCLVRGAMSETLHDEEPKVGARALQGLRAGAKGRAVRRETRRHLAGTRRHSAGRRGIRQDGARRHGVEGHKKGPTAGSVSGRGGLGAEVT